MVFVDLSFVKNTSKNLFETYEREYYKSNHFNPRFFSFAALLHAARIEMRLRA